MDAMECLLTRRSIRKFLPDAVDRKVVEDILDAANWAPSAKNSQPWKFYVLTGEKKNRVCDLMVAAADRMEAMGIRIGSVRGTAAIMRQAPVLVVITDPANFSGGVINVASQVADAAKDPSVIWPAFIPLLVEVQSVGAAFQNMCLAAHAKGLGSLWIGDIYVAAQEVYQLLGLEGDLMGAISIGYTDMNPAPRPRKTWQEVTVFVE